MVDNFLYYVNIIKNGIDFGFKVFFGNFSGIKPCLQIFENYYETSDFVQIIDGTPKLKNVVASNYAHIGVSRSGDSVVVMCAIDNLVKGAASGAIQWMNRLWSLPESSGLTTPPPAWT